MTIPSQDARTGPYNGDGSTTGFDYDFKVVDQAHLVVTLTSSTGTDTVQTITTDYTVSGVGAEGGGTVTMVTAPASGEKLTITRDVTKTQEVDLQNRGAFSPQVIENALDKLTQITQDLTERLGRTITSSVTATAGAILPSASAGSFLRWNTEETGLENASLASLGELAVPGASTDNALVRFDGTDGNSLQNSPVVVTDAGNVTGVNQLSLSQLNGTPIGNYLIVADLGSSVQEYNAATVFSDTTANLTVGYTTSLYVISSPSVSATHTVDFEDGQLQYVVMDGNWTLNSPAVSQNGAAVILVANGASTYTITIDAAFDNIIGTYDGTADHAHFFRVTRLGAVSTLEITKVY